MARTWSQRFWISALNFSGLIPGGRRAFRRRLPVSVTEIEGRRFELHPADNYSDYRMFVDRHFSEPASVARLRDLVRGKRCLMLDVGMNSGVFTVALAPEMAPSSRVIGIEANPALLPRIARNLALNGLTETVEVNCCAVGAETGTARLTVNKRNLGGSTLQPGAGRDGIEVPLRRLPDLVPEVPEAELFLVKIDIEGLEDAALIPLLAGPGRLPDYIMLEVAHRAQWQRPLERELAERGYGAVFSSDGNTLFARAELPDATSQDGITDRRG